MFKCVGLRHFCVIRKNFFSCLKPIHHWHSNVHQDVVVNYAAAYLSEVEFNLVVGLEAIQSRVRFELELARQDFLKRVNVELAIVD